MVAVSPAVPPVNDMVGVVSFVTLSVLDEPVSLDATRSGAAGGADGAVVSTVIDNAEPAADVLPAGSVMVDVTDQMPVVRPDMVQEVTLAVTVYEQVFVVPPLTALIVTVSPICAPGTVNVGAVAFVMLSEFDEPVSVTGSRSGVAGVGAALSTVKFSGVDAGDTFPAGSVMVAVEDQLPGVRVGRSHDVATPIV